MSDFIGAKLTSQALEEIVSDIKTISGDVDEIMGNFQKTMGKITGNAEGGIVRGITDTGVQLFDGVMKLSGCFLKLGLQIGDYMKMMFTHDRDLAQTLRDRIENM